MRRYSGGLLLILLLCVGCGQALPESGTPAEAPPEEPVQAAPAEEPEKEPSEEAETPEDGVLLTLEAPLADGRTLTLEAVGKVEDEYTAGVREVRVYDGDALLQTASVREAIEKAWDFGDGILAEDFYNYTKCWKPEGSMEVLDLNFDGNTDFGLFGWPANNTIPYYCWLWDSDTDQYQYAFVLQEPKVHPETGELTGEYKSGTAGSQWIKEVYKPGGDGRLSLDRVERDTCDFEPAPPSQLDFDRGWAEETWIPPEGREPISPGDDLWSIEEDLILIRRKVPVFEVNKDNTVSHFTELWERRDGELQMTEREEFFYE